MARSTCASTQAHDFHGVRPTCARTQDDDVQMSSASPPAYRGHKPDVSQQMREEEQVRLRAVAANGTPGFAYPVSGPLPPDPRSLARHPDEAWRMPLTEGAKQAAVEQMATDCPMEQDNTNIFRNLMPHMVAGSNGPVPSVTAPLQPV